MSKTIHTQEEIQLMTRLFTDAEEMVNNGNDTDAEVRYQTILECDPGNEHCLFRLGELYNRNKQPEKSYEYHTRAFVSNRRLAELLTNKDHVSFNYKYQEVLEDYISVCPICGGNGEPHSVYNDVTNVDFIPGFNPVRMWMYCAACEHLYARSYPRNLNKVLANSQGSFHMKPNINLLNILGEVMNRIHCYAKGDRLLDIGVGAGELTAVAKEFNYNVSGIEIRKAYADQVSKLLDICVHNIDFTQYSTTDRYDVITMGDVLEHLLDPVLAIKKVYSIMNENGVLWISTPNFRSAYSSIMKQADPMWRVCEHLNYFSYHSLTILLEKAGFTVLDYNCSKHYNGSMEVIAKRKAE